jgi:L-fucose isomerase-like protein
MPKAGNLTMDYASLIPFISPEASAYRSASDYVDLDSSLTAPVVANSPATELIKRVANRSFDTSGVTRVLHDVDTNTEAAIPVDPIALHRYNDIIANPDIAYDIIRRSIESQARRETDNELNSQDAVRMFGFVRKNNYPNP